MHHLSNFLSEFRQGFQQSSRFEVQLYVPPTLLQTIITSNGLLEIIDRVLPNIGQRIDPTFSASQAASWLARGLTCEGVTLPNRFFDQSDLTLYGMTERFPSHTNYASVTCTFRMPLVEADNAIPRFFNYWMNYIQHGLNGIESGMDFRWPEQYYGTLFVSTFDRKGHTSGTYKFERVYPKHVHGVSLSWESSSNFLVQNVEFEYSYWVLLPYTPPPLIEIDINL